LNLSQRIAYFCLRGVAELFRLLPWSALPPLADALAFLLYRIVGYRRNVVFENLRSAFPEKNDVEIGRIAAASYQNLCDVTLETIKAFTASVEEIRRRCPCLNPEVVNAYLDQGQTVLVTGSHYNNWELACLSIPEGLHGAAVTVYKPLTNKVVDAYYNQNRSRGGTLLAAMDEVFALLRKRRSEASAFLFLSDQSPSSRKSAQWVDFLHQDSAFLPGVDVLARKFEYPVLHFHIRRLRRGFYELHYRELVPSPGEAAEGDITRAYAAVVEAEIRAQPENWLWSHRRWKMKR
jgi:Kdo2-lipid IVA lauroyltransferase/acyltransferase